MLAPLSDVSTQATAAQPQAWGLALAHHRAGRLDAARALYQRLLAQSPDNPALLHSMGTLAGQSGDLQGAARLIAQAIALDGTQPLYYWNLAHALRSTGQTEGAIAALQALLLCEPTHGQAPAALVELLLAVGRPGQARMVCEQALVAQPGQARLVVLRGEVLLALQLWEQAHAQFALAIAHALEPAKAYAGQAAAFIGQHAWQAACASLDSALALAPGDAKVWFLQGVALQGLGAMEQAHAAYSQAIRCKPSFALAYSNRANLAQQAGALDAALADYDAALQHDRHCAPALWNKALVLLLQGDYAQGWPLHEWRWHKDAMRAARARFTQPQWTGAQAVQGKTVLLCCEQGLGDSIQFVRYALQVQALGARVVVRAPASLRTLFASMDSAIACISDAEPLPALDYHCPMMSLPLALGTTLATVPAPVPYLHADRHQVAAWEQRLGPRRRLRVGLACSGNPTHAQDAARSMALAQWMHHLPQDCDYISLQNAHRPDDMHFLQSHGGLRFFGDQLDDFAATAALCACMDVVISVDTSIAHLAGAMGQPTWVLLPAVPDWRWLLHRQDSPWYPTMTLYRQHTPGRWDDVLQRLGRDLALRLGAAGATQPMHPQASAH